jgi:hypothetical protein
MKRRVVPVLASSLLLWAASASTAQEPVRLPEVRVVAPAHDNWYSAWSFTCEFTRHNSKPESVTLRVWDDSFWNRSDWREPRHAPTWTITATRAELEAMNLRVRGSQGLWGLDNSCAVESIKTGEKLNLEEAWVVFGDILSKHQAAAADRDEAQGRAIRERLGIPQQRG